MDKLINALMMYKRKSLKSYACSMTLESMVFFFILHKSYWSFFLSHVIKLIAVCLWLMQD